MNRRAFLAGAGGGISVVLAGCVVTENFHLRMEPVADTEQLATKASVAVAEDHTMESEIEHILAEEWHYKKGRDEPVFEADTVYQYKDVYYTITPHEESPDDASDGESAGADDSNGPNPDEIYYFDVEEVATNREEYVEYLRKEYRIELTGLTVREAATIEQAIDDGASTTADDMTDAFESVWETITDGPELPNDGDPDHLVSYGDSGYFVEVSNYTSEW